jgi:competence protein ComGC
MNHDKAGFTLIELMLAMTFIAGLLVVIAMTTIQISNIYTKGITLREVNQAGRAVVDDMQRTIAASAQFDASAQSPTDPTSHYVKQDGGGRLCVGSYSYVWNYGNKLVAGVTGAPNKYDDNSTLVRFAKVADASASLCSNPGGTVKRADATELLANGDRDLVLHSFSIAPGATDPSTEQSLYAISMTIGTNSGNELISTGDASCKPPSDAAGFQNYCSVNQFDIIARAGNKAGGSN